MGRVKGIVGVEQVKPDEEDLFSHDWKPKLPVGTSVSSVTAEAREAELLTDVTSSLIISSLTVDGVTTVEYKGLTDLKDYFLKLTMDRSDGAGPFSDVYLIRCRKVGF